DRESTAAGGVRPSLGPRLTVCQRRIRRAFAGSWGDTQPKVPALWRLLAWLTRTLAGMILGCLTILFILTALLRPEVQPALFGFAILLAVFWFIWSQLPTWFRKLVKKAFDRRKRSHEQ